MKHLTMSKAIYLLIALGTVLVLVLYWFLLLSPKREAIAVAQEDAAQAIEQQGTVRNRIRSLESARSRAPEVEAEMALASAVIPEGMDMPAALRSLQDAADASGVDLMSVLPDTGRLSTISPELREVEVAVAVEGGFYQIVDFLRRVEDPRITSRAMVTNFLVVSSRTYPRLRVDMGVKMFYTEQSPGMTPASAGATFDPAATAPEVDVNALAEVSR